jgi:cytochrome P450
MRADQFPLGAAVTIAELEGDPHALLARLREREPVSWLPALGGWLITRRDLALEAMRDATRFTVDDPRFSTAQVVGASMLSLDGPEHARHRAPFTEAFRLREVQAKLAGAVREEAEALVDALRPQGRAELRRGFAGPLAAAVVTRALGLPDPRPVLGLYDAIVGAVTDLSAGRPVTPAARAAVDTLGELIEPALADETSLLAHAARGGLASDEVASNAAVLMFGGIETTEGMIANAIVHLLGDAAALSLVRDQPAVLPAAVEESLRLEPAAAAVDRYAVADTRLGDAEIAAGDLVRISISAANRDPGTFADPDRFDPLRPNARRHLAFAGGPHVCVGMHLARLEAHAAVAAVLERLPGVRLDGPAEIRGLVFRKPAELHVRWQ